MLRKNTVFHVYWKIVIYKMFFLILYSIVIIHDYGTLPLELNNDIEFNNYFLSMLTNITRARWCVIPP